eukprot:gene15090-6262_t
MKSFLIADILGEDNDKEMKMQGEECDECKSARSEKGACKNLRLNPSFEIGSEEMNLIAPQDIKRTCRNIDPKRERQSFPFTHHSFSAVFFEAKRNVGSPRYQTILGVALAPKEDMLPKITTHQSHFTANYLESLLKSGQITRIETDITRKSPSAKTKGNRKCGDVHESSCLPSWRRKFTEGQTTNLEEIFLRQKYITGKERAEIANTLGLTTKQVKTWFQNRRTKWKREKQRNAYGAEFFRQDGCLSLPEDLQRGVDRYARCCELPYVPINDWGCYVMSNTLPVSLPTRTNLFYPAWALSLATELHLLVQIRKALLLMYVYRIKKMLRFHDKSFDEVPLKVD